MASNMELVPLTSHKHDPAWKHCDMFKTGDRVLLKCKYCGKIFKGGGIHRIKEHLAGQKGNAATCLRVQSDVKMEMLESLNRVAVRKRKKQKPSGELSSYDNADANAIDRINIIHIEEEFFPVPERVEHFDADADREDSSAYKTGYRKKKGRVRKAVGAVVSDVAPLSTLEPSPNMISNSVHMAVGRFFIDVGLPAEAVNSAYFQPMVDAIASNGNDFVPSYHDLSSWVSRNIVYETRNDVDHFKGIWERTGCTLLVDDRMSGNDISVVSFFVYCSEGAIFFRSANLSAGTGSSDELYELLKETVEQVGLKNVLQVITRGDDRYTIAGEKLVATYPSIFWSPCASHCIDLMLQDMGDLPMVKVILDQAKLISRYIYSNSAILNMFRKHTLGVDLPVKGITPSSTDFMTLRRMLTLRHKLQLMVTSEDWMASPYSKKPEGFALLDCITSPSFWSACTSVTNLTDSLLRLLKIVGSEKKPAMGFVYAGLYRAKEAIKKQLATKEYLVYWNIIDHRWAQLKRHPLHAAGFYLNPKFFYSLEGDAHLYTRSLVYDCIEKMVPDPDIQDKIMKETASYHGCLGDFGRKMAIRARDTLPPIDWWLAYDGTCPNLARLAIRILSQTCSLVHLKPDKIPIESISGRKNIFEHQRRNDIAFVRYNMQMKQMFSANKEEENVDPIASEYNDIAEWIVDDGICTETPTPSEWMKIDSPFVDAMRSDPDTCDYTDDLGTGFDDNEIFDGNKECGEETGGDNTTGINKLSS